MIPPQRHVDIQFFFPLFFFSSYVKQNLFEFCRFEAVLFVFIKAWVRSVVVAPGANEEADGPNN